MSETHAQPPVQSEQGPNRRGRRAAIIAGTVVTGAAIIVTRLLVNSLADTAADKAADNLWGQPDPVPPVVIESEQPAIPQPNAPNSPSRPPSSTEPRPSPSAAEVPDFTWQSCKADVAVDRDTDSLLVEVRADYTGNLQDNSNDTRIVAWIENDHHGDTLLFTEQIEEGAFADDQVSAALNSDGRFSPSADTTEITNIFVAEFPPNHVPSFNNGRNQPNPLENLPEEYYIPCGIFGVAANGTVTPIDN